MKTSTRCVHLESNDDPFGATVPPLYQTATFRQPCATEFGEYDYTRSGNPTRTQLEKQLAALENGSFASAFASGMAALTAVTRLVQAGDEIIASDDLYGGTVRLLEQILPRQGIGVSYADTTNLSAVCDAFTPRTKLLLLETPTNPLLRISDIRALAQIVHANGALLAVDNTMLSPCLQQPLALGADVVIHSATKFLCGHSDVMAGAVVTGDADLNRQITFVQNAEGAGLSPFDSWLLLRGIKTLDLRVERQNASAFKVAEFLARQRGVEKVYYPGFTSHEGYEIHSRQATGGGAVISFSTGDADLSQRIAEATKLFSLAVSFGSVGSSISLPYRMSHSSIPANLRERLAPPVDLVRLSVGIEDVGDLCADLEQAFSAAIKQKVAAA
jgi:cystathionine beta-lyase